MQICTITSALPLAGEIFFMRYLDRHNMDITVTQRCTMRLIFTLSERRNFFEEIKKVTF